MVPGDITGDVDFVSCCGSYAVCCLRMVVCGSEVKPGSACASVLCLRFVLKKHGWSHCTNVGGGGLACHISHGDFMFLLQVVAVRLRLSQAKWWASAHSRSVDGKPMPTKDDFAWNIDALANFSMSVRPRSATPLSCGVFADVNSRLMPFLLQISANWPYISSGALSERMIPIGPT